MRLRLALLLRESSSFIFCSSIVLSSDVTRCEEVRFTVPIVTVVEPVVFVAGVRELVTSRVGREVLVTAVETCTLSVAEVSSYSDEGKVVCVRVPPTVALVQGRVDSATCGAETFDICDVRSDDAEPTGKAVLLP